MSEEQSGFKPDGQLSTRVLSVYRKVKNNLAANVPTLAVYVDYKKAYDMIWHMGLIVKLRDLGMPIALLKITMSWLGTRQAYITLGETRSDNFEINIGLPKCSSLSPYLFIVFHCDLIKCIGAHSGHLLADELSVLIRALSMKSLSRMMKYMRQKGTRPYHSLVEYSKK